MDIYSVDSEHSVYKHIYESKHTLCAMTYNSITMIAATQRPVQSILSKIACSLVGAYPSPQNLGIIIIWPITSVALKARLKSIQNTLQQILWKSPFFHPKFVEIVEGPDIVCMDWKELYNDVINKYPNEKLIFILDPPYLYSDKTNYQMYHFKLHHTLELIEIMKHYKYMLFNGKESEFNKIVDILNKLYEDTEKIEYEIIYNKMVDFTHSGKDKYDFLMYRL